MGLTNELFQGVVAVRDGAGQAVGRIRIGNLGVGLPKTRITGLSVTTITSATGPGDARARALCDQWQAMRKRYGCISIHMYNRND
jgi:hypothetical protein